MQGSITIEQMHQVYVPLVLEGAKLPLYKVAVYHLLTARGRSTEKISIKSINALAVDINHLRAPLFFLLEYQVF